MEEREQESQTAWYNHSFAMPEPNTPPNPAQLPLSIGRVITSDDCVAEGAAWLARVEPRFAHALTLTGALPLRLKPDGFDQLLSAIVSQQVSVASANAIWKRMRRPG